MKKVNANLLKAAISIIDSVSDDYKGDYSNECLLYAKIANDSANIGLGACRLLEVIKAIKAKKD